MQHLFFPRAGRRAWAGWLALAWLVVTGSAAVAQPTTYCTTNLGAFCGTGNANINLVAVAGTALNNPNTTCTAATGYTLYPTAGSTTGTLARGLTYQVSVMTPEAGIISVWFDWDQSGTFDAGEWTQVTTASTAGQPATAGVTVPATAALGPTGMRVRSRLTGNQNGAADACLLFGSGETEDYTVTIGPAPACAPPTFLTATNITTASATLGFGGTSNGTAVSYAVQYGVAGFVPGSAGSTTVTPAGTATAVGVTGLAANTVYQFYVTKDCGGGATSQAAGPFTFRTACVAPTYAALPVIESFENTWLSVCGTRDAPTLFWRTSPAAGNASWRRDDDGAGAAWTSPTVGAYTPAGSQGARSARFHSYYAGAGAVGLLDLYVDLSAAGAKRMSFDYLNTAGNDSLQVQVSTDGGSTFGAPLLRLGLSGPVAQGWRTQTLNLSSTAATAVVRFRTKVTAAFTSDIGLDNLRLETATGCLTPASLAVGDVTANSASLSWLTGGPGTYSVLYGPAGFNPTLPSSGTNAYTTVAGLAAPPYPITGLAASTAYQFYVQQNCAAGANSGLAGPVAFQTACITPLYAALPVTESFENAWLSRCDTRDVPTNNWRNTPGTGNASWRREDDGASGAWVSPGSWAYAPTGSQGTHSARFHSGEASNGQVGTFDLFVDLSAAGAKRLSFDYINTDGADSLVVQLSADGGATFGRLAGFNRSGPAAAGFVTRVLPIASTAATAVIRFRGRADFGVTDIGLDNIVLEPATGCLTPANLTATTTTTTAALSWLVGGTGTYSVTYGPTGFVPGGAGGTTAAGLAGPPFNLTGLAPGTTYQFYVTLNCAGSTSSGTAGPASFSTQILNDEPCGATLLAINNACTPLATTTAGATATTGVPAGACNGFPTATPVDVWFRFVTAATGPTSTQVRLSVTGAAANTLRAYAGAACTGPLVFVQCASATNGTTAAPSLDLTGLVPSTTYYVRVGSYSSFQPVLGTFTICATPVPNCATPTGLAAGPLTSTSAELSWATPPVPGSTFTVYYGPAGFTPPAGTRLAGLTAPTTTLTGLTPNTNYCFFVQQVCGGFNGSSAISTAFCFTTPLPAAGNDEPCGAVTLGAAAVSGTNAGATTSVQNGIQTPACAPAALPKDVWFALTPAGTSTTLTLTGTAGGMVRLFTSPDCALGPFAQVACRNATGSNVGFAGPLTFTGLVAGTRYYVAVSGYGSSDATGSFTIGATSLLATQAQVNATALTVYPNPSSTGQLILRLAGPAGPGRATLLNALGQAVLSQALAGVAEQTLPTRGLAAGLYTLRVALAGQVFTRKVILE